MLSIINECMMDYYAQKWSNTIQLLSKYITFTLSIQTDAWTHSHLHTIHYNQYSAIYIQYCAIFFVKYLVQCVIHGQVLNIKGNIHTSTILPINQIKYRMVSWYCSVDANIWSIIYSAWMVGVIIIVPSYV